MTSTVKFELGLQGAAGVLALGLAAVAGIYAEQQGWPVAYSFFPHHFQKANAVLGGFGLFTIMLLVGVWHKRFDVLGMVFLVLTSVQFGLAFWLLRPLIHAQPSNELLKIQAFGLFIYYLLIETLLAIRLLQKKQ